MSNVGSIITSIAGIDRAPVFMPSNRNQWFIHGGIAALRGLTGSHFFASGSALNDRGSDLALAIGSGAGPILRLLLRRRPVLSLGRVSRDSDPLASFLSHIGLEPASRCNAIVSLNGTLVVFGRFAGRNAVVHFPTSKISHAQMMRHQHGLESAHSELADFDLAHLLPELLCESDTHLVESMTEGEFLDLRSLSQCQLTVAITAGLDIAVVLHRIGQNRREGGPAFLFFPELDDVVRMVREQDKVLIGAARAALERWNSPPRLWSVPMHGDLWLGNLCFNKDFSRVTGVVDWEWYDGHGGPLLDVIHLIIMSVAIHRRVPVSALLPEIWLDRDEYLRMLFDRACTLFNVERAVFQWMGIASWLNLVAHGAIEPRPTRFDAWLNDIVCAPGAAVREWIASQCA